MDASVNRILASVDERALLIAIKLNEHNIDLVEDSLDELKLLVKTAGVRIVDSITISRNKLDPAFIVGKGYVDSIKKLVGEKKVKLIVFDLNNIRPAQVRNLEEVLKVRIVGRTEVILDIFARRARSSESKIQVELAQLKYILPRLKGLGGVLSRLGGGIGTRGPGEKMLETDRRHILRRISKLNSKLRKISEHRRLIRKARTNEILGAVVGYTNAGKSTLINSLARDDLFVENRLFATLDAYTRMVYINSGTKVLLTDTVGFIKNLPSNLIESFKSTLEEIKNAHFLIHVVDITSRDILGNIRTVKDELLSLDCQDKPIIMFFNKIDSINDEHNIERINNTFTDSIIGSALQENGIDVLKDRIAEIHNYLRNLMAV
jgi:GTP-binding protein HflX